MPFVKVFMNYWFDYSIRDHLTLILLMKRHGKCWNTMALVGREERCQQWHHFHFETTTMARMDTPTVLIKLIEAEEASQIRTRQWQGVNIWPGISIYWKYVMRRNMVVPRQSTAYRPASRPTTNHRYYETTIWRFDRHFDMANGWIAVPKQRHRNVQGSASVIDLFQTIVRLIQYHRRTFEIPNHKMMSWYTSIFKIVK